MHLRPARRAGRHRGREQFRSRGRGLGESIGLPAETGRRARRGFLRLKGCGMVRGVKNVEDRTPSDLLEIDNDDDNALRLMVIVPWELPGTWEEWRELFPQGPVRISIFRRPTAFDGTSRRLREPVRRRAERSEERRVGKECRSRWSPYH